MIAPRSVPALYSDPGSTHTVRLSLAAFFVSWICPWSPRTGWVSRIAERKVVLPTGIKTCCPPRTTGRGGVRGVAGLRAEAHPGPHGGGGLREREGGGTPPAVRNGLGTALG